MKITEYRIQNYKAIKDAKININSPIIPIVGVNEAGKTSILSALLALDRNRDKVNLGKHLEYENKYSTNKTLDCKISAILSFSQEDILEFNAHFKLKKKKNLNQIDLSFLLNDNIVSITRELSEPAQGYKLEGVNLDILFTNELTKLIVNKLPFFLYFDDFTDRVPDEIPFTEDYKTSGKISQTKNKEWQEIVVEIFRRADVEGIGEDNPLMAFFSIKDEDRRDDILSDIEQILNNEIIAEWKRIKSSGHKNFADDSENLTLELKVKENTFSFKVRDTSNSDKKRTFSVSARSKGFQWFFNYMVKLKFNPRYKGKKENSIFLLDEPGSYLHSSAQSELLEELKRVSKNNTIIYCTHSQFLLNPNSIRLGSIRIAEKHKSVVNIFEYGNYKSKDDKGALSPVYQALQLNFARDFIGKIVITEGITDFYFFSLIKKHSNLITTDFNIIPGAGSGQSHTLISAALGFSENFIVLFDNDSGKQAFKNYKKTFGETILEKYFQLYSDKKDFRLENFLSPKDIKQLLEITNTNDLKKAFAILYYDITELQQKKFIKDLSVETIQELMPIISRINAL